MLPFTLVAVVFLTQSPDDTAVRRAAAERFLNERTRSCGAATAAEVEGWPAGEDAALTTDMFFAQRVDGELEQALQRAARDMVKGVLQPLGISAVTDDGKRGAAVAFTGVAEALTPPGAAADTKVFSGAWWRGTISLHVRGRCVFSRAWEDRMQLSEGPRAIAVSSASDAPFLDSLEPVLLDALVATAEAIRGQAGLSRIATSDADSRACLLALGRVTDQGILAGLARTAKPPWLRIPAVAKLLDVNRMANIASVDPDLEVRRAALTRIAELKQKTSADRSQ